MSFVEKFSKVFDKESITLHVWPAAEKEQGIQAIIVSSKDRANRPPSHFGLPDELKENHVYLQTTQRAQAFRKFSAAEDAIILPLQTYLETLKFFQEGWQRVEKKIKLELRHMRQEVPMTIIPSIARVGQGCIIYERLYNDALLHIRADSKDPTDRMHVTLHYNKRSVHLDPKVVADMMQGYDWLKNEYKESA